MKSTVSRARREFLVMVGATLFAAPLAVSAQAKKPIVIGWLSPNMPEEGRVIGLAAFKEGLAGLGWKESAHYVVEERWAQGRVERLQQLAEELAAMRCAVIVTNFGAATMAAARAAPSTPIVQANGGSPVDLGLAKSLARPGGMVTGLSAMPAEIAEKYIELLTAAAPGIKRVGFLFDPHSPGHGVYLKMARRTAEHHRVEAHFAGAAKAEELEPAIARLAKEGVQALVALPSTWFPSERPRLINLALSHRWPMIYGTSGFAEAGALLGYGARRRELQRRAAFYVDRILKGAKPGELPIEQATTFELVVNLRTAKMLGITIPQSVLVQATRVIE